MAGAACKIILNNGVGGLSKSLEAVLMSPLVRGVMMTEKKSDILIQQLADIDLACYDPRVYDMPVGGLCGILEELQALNVITEEVRAVFK